MYVRWALIAACPRRFEFHTIGHHVKSYPPARFLTERCARRAMRVARC
eukprot:COSAG01_NODE_1900_length_8964_cov_121.219177_8_plen_48_part_00